MFCFVLFCFVLGVVRKVIFVFVFVFVFVLVCFGLFCFVLFLKRDVICGPTNRDILVVLLSKKAAELTVVPRRS